MFSIRTNILITFSVILIHHPESSQAKRSVEIRNIESRFSPKYFTNFTTHLHNKSLYIEMDTIKVLKTGYRGHIEFQIRLDGSKIYQTLFSTTMDICNMVISVKDSIYKKWFRSVLKYGNFMQNCPVASGHYYLKGWKLDAELIPSFLYAGDYRVKGVGFYGKYKSKNQDFVVGIDLDLTLKNQNS